MLRRPFPIAAVAAALAATGAHGQVATDGTLGAATALAGPNFAIPASLGRQAGANLFHSFSTFSIPTGGSATFSGPAGISNVISRVTGGGASSIDGRIASSITGANVYLLNPSGILFGPNASLDIGGSFYASTANYLKFADGTRFETNASAPAALSIAPPEAFGFLGTATPGAIVLQGARLNAAPGQSISLIGGPLTVQDSNIRTVGGDVRVIGALAGEVRADGVPEAGARLAPVAIMRSEIAAESAADLAPGRITIRGGRLTVQDASLSSLNESPLPAGSIELAAAERLTVSNTSISSMTGGPGRGADIALSGVDVTVDHASQVGSMTWGDGAGGDVTVLANGTALVAAAPQDADYTNIYSWAFAGGRGGSLRVVADKVAVQSGNLYSYAEGAGDAGGIAIRGREVSVSDGAYVYSYTWWPAQGRAGDIDILAGERVLVSGMDWNGYEAFVFTQSRGPGRAGDITVAAPRIDVIGASFDSGAFASGRSGNLSFAGDVIRFAGGNGWKTQIETGTKTFSTGDGGSIRVRASQRIEVDGTAVTDGPEPWTRIAAVTQGEGQGGDIVFEAPVVLIDRASLFSRTRFGSGAQGGIIVRADDLTLRNEGSLSSSAEGPRTGSFVLVEARSLTMEDTSAIVSVSSSSGGAGSVTLNADRIRMTGSSYIDTSSSGSGAAGTITLDARESFDMVDRSVGSYLDLGAAGSRGTPVWPGGVVSRAMGSGDAGDIVIRSPRVFLDSGRVLATVAGTGQGGRIAVEAGDLLLVNGSQIDAKALPGATGSAGEITVTVGNRLEISGKSPVDGLVSGINTETSGPGHAGSIRVRASTARIDEGFITSSTAGAGNAGTIDVSGGTLSLRNGARVEASALPGASGSGGSVTLYATEGIALAGEGTMVSTRTAGRGAGGTIAIRAPQVTITSGAQVSATTSGAGAAGRVQVSGDTVAVAAGARVEAQALPGSTGTGGDIAVGASASILVSGTGTEVSTGTAGSGAGGELKLVAPSIAVVDGALVAAGSTGPSNGGAIMLEANRIVIGSGASVAATSSGDGAAGRIDVRAADALNLFGGSITTSTAGGGAGGMIAIFSPEVAIGSGALVSATTSGTGAAGRVEVIADRVAVVAGGQVEAQTLPGSSGDGGDVTITGSSSILVGGAGTTISTSTAGSGAGGELKLVAPSIAIVDGALVAAGSTSTGAGGAITLDANVVRVAGGAAVAATSTGAGAAGRIDVRAADALYLYGGAITTDAQAADGGNIDVRAGRLIHLRGGEISTSVAGGGGAGGNIFIDPTFVILEGGSRVFANAYGGPGGNISLIADYFFASIDSLVLASSALGVPGTINIASPQNNVNSTLAKLPSATIDASALLRDTCGTRAAGGGSSSLVDVGRGGLAGSPERLSASRYFGPATPQLAPGPMPAGAPQVAAAERARLAGCAG